MGKLDPLLPCPHCGNAMRAGSLKRHEPLCVKNPATFARYHDVLTAAPGSNRGITCGRYVELSTADKSLPMVITLRRLTGKKNWDDVLAVFGLRPPLKEQQRSQCPHCGVFVAAANMEAHKGTCKALQPKAEPPPKLPKERKVYTFKPETQRKPRTKPEPQICPHCNAQRLDMSKHICPEDPAVVAWLEQVLPDPQRPGCIITCAMFKEITPKAIGAGALTEAYDSWGELAARYGLRLRTGRADAASKLDAASIAELHRLAQELHGGEFGPSLSEYQMYAINGIYTAAGLAKMFGQRWAAVLESAGLRNGTRSEYTRAAQVRRKAHEAAQGQRAIVASKYERGDEPISREQVGLPVASVRRLPSGGTAMMIR